MRKRTIAAAITFALIAGVVVYQAATHVEPEPYVELDTGRPRTPVVEYLCSAQGELMIIYTGSDGQQIGPVRHPDTERRCWRSTMDQQINADTGSDAGRDSPGQGPSE